MNGQPNGRVHITQGSYVSLGVVVLLVLSTLWIKSGISENLSTAVATKNDLSNQLEKLDTRLKTLENQKNSWSAVDMLQWSIHLQQLNKDPKVLQVEGLKVPEPVITK